MPRTAARYLIPTHILRETQSFLYGRGQDGCEGMLLWVGTEEDEVIHITRAFIPEQTCIRTRYGVAVELTPRAHYTLPDALGESEQFYVRVHSHPSDAYHSERDNQNAVLTHQGALSVVVPDFAVRPLDLADCAIYRLEYGKGWVRLDGSAIAQLFEVVP